MGESLDEFVFFFYVYKFCFMVVDVELYLGVVWVSKDDLRIIVVGCFMCKICIDEFL